MSGPHIQRSEARSKAPCILLEFRLCVWFYTIRAEISMHPLLKSIWNPYISAVAWILAVDCGVAKAKRWMDWIKETYVDFPPQTAEQQVVFAYIFAWYFPLLFFLFNIFICFFISKLSALILVWSTDAGTDAGFLAEIISVETGYESSYSRDCQNGGLLERECRSFNIYNFSLSKDVDTIDLCHYL